ncbi:MULTISPECIES: bifunctional adenosylcobinamide kinase/adenosylcobinamide-phosphate guanylyltransferase [unclassified Shewanella]|uniref:bifunctional adenosylcobinamide kinase/adenosylcobinamide-phosphate guanylyltransferase n=1 Tax=unclassified Shewanella TaxID=196818 RepID=UPI000C85454E|nr:MULTISPECIES: bifunctional adenosylcobinamide kinase/adenosylcobinamide-phosphate guanylyltransferase [unclassified Shewanella]MDO6618921.1 bifunctional adenosylcobinamide kinase/adenosylcobinamide-phosphate guanylyltransferase [Shewanella sp. 6_MG-2023]MDO6677708.1 bifunctional adenosylcobinamide kinase/adenosylcobinamide-phosphate guanylyltransferase [Shewanella sp. 4_MG-2023]PMG48950.1 bifunctional adenosylcobinamide kinase/adenosylcobinamide-phosphate guanylyltransferase [Shewanella sp. 1
MIHLVLGGARSGKSRYGESLAEPFALQGHRCVYIATATALDDEMKQRILRHQQDRDNSNIDWQLVETPLAIAHTLVKYDSPNTVLFVDCLTLYLTNHLVASEETHRDGVDELWQQQKQALLACLPTLEAQVILISNEVGSGIVPLGELSRRFADEAGWLNQAIAKIADKVTLVVAGLPVELKR